MTAADTERRRFAEIFGGRPGDTDMATLARKAASEGYAVLPIKPGEKKPLCPLTKLQRERADRSASATAKLAGQRGWERARHDCGIAHATKDAKVADRNFKRLAKDHPDLNMAVSVSESAVLVIDCDTALELESFTSLWAKRERCEDLMFSAPTVRTPGERGSDGEWKHSEGGHYWFLLPEDVDFGELNGVTTIPIGTNAEHPAALKLWGYALVPPSVRPEGAYVMASDVNDAPDWLIDHVMNYLDRREDTVRERRDRALDRGEQDDRLQLAQSGMAWSSILEPLGWQLHYKTDRCGCEMWTAPGEHADGKSATAHDPGCGRRDSVDGWLHVWTDNQPDGMSASGQKNYSKIQVLAWSRFEGDIRSAMVELGLAGDPDNQPTVLHDEELYAEENARLDSTQDEDADTDEDDEDEQDDEQEAAEELTGAAKILADLWRADELDQLEPAVPLVEGMFDKDTIARVIGRSGHGKSFFMIDIAGHVALGREWHRHAVTQGNVVYMVAEGLKGIRKRVRAWERHVGNEPLGGRVQFLPYPVQVADDMWVSFVVAMKRLDPVPSLIVIDTQARVTAGANENGPEEMSVLVQRCELLREKTGACVVLVHHKGHQGDHGRGWSGVIAAMDAEIEVERQDKSDKVTITSGKQKDQGDFDPFRLRLKEVPVVIDEIVDTSSILVDRDDLDGAAEEPFPKRPAIDEASSSWDRVAAWLYRFFEEGNGASKAELWRVVADNDKDTRGRPMSRSAFYKAWSHLEGVGALVQSPTSATRVKLDPQFARDLGVRDD